MSDQGPVVEGQVPDPARWRILVVLLVTMFMSLIGVSIVNVVLPSIQSGLGASQSDIQWVLSGYALTFGVVLVAAGRAGDVFGRGALFIAGVVVFTLSSVAAGLAPDPLSLNIARFIQGVGSGLINPQVLGMIQQYFRGRERGRAYGAMGTMVGFSVAIGPLLGGVLIAWLGSETGWRATFLVNVPVGIVVIVLALTWFPRPLFARAPNTVRQPVARAVGEVGAARRVRKAADLDPVGSILLGVGVLALLLPFVQGRQSPWVWWLLPGGLAVIAGWVLWERNYTARGRSPMVDLRLFGIRSFTFGTLIAGLYFVGITSVWVLVAIYVQDGQGFSALDAGLLGLPAALCAAVSSHLAGLRIMEYGRKIVIFGILSALFGLLASIVVIELHAAGYVGLWWLLPTLAFIGIAQGAIIAPNQALTMLEVPESASGSAGGVMQTSQRIGTAVGIAMMTGIFFATLRATAWDTAMSVGLASIAVVVLATLLVALADQRRRTRGTPAPRT
ncbi:MFS transporter [Paeniglutamicibacter gangotriensis]|uniref:MFS transporter n=1 Tax=Paeniglutamicibacter gangotriensis TaxID=254787 RepID=A0A5B0EHZ6_9MICC|nr:MFS transporter [Paeniglutamicibacter gangotriensis]KAA0978667.1 MFS transporter [Paeniglutamicibacter gangotriensis]